MPAHIASIHTVWAAIAIMLVILFLVAWRKITIYIEERRLSQLHELRHATQRLRTVVAELLANVNELDQGGKYLIEKSDNDWSRRLGVTCQELVSLGDSLPLVDQLLDHQNVSAGREGLLRSCRMASKIVLEVDEIKREAQRTITDRSRTPRHPGEDD
jgi:hypothetical protein